MKKIVVPFILSLLLAACASQPTAPTKSNEPKVAVAPWAAQTKQLILQGEIPTAQFILDNQDYQNMSRGERAWYAYLQMQVAKAMKANEYAYQWSQSPWLADLNLIPKEDQVLARLTVAEVYELNFQYLAAIRERVFISNELASSSMQENHDAIWNDFQQLTPEQINQLADFQGYTDMGVWAELALISQRYQMSLKQLSMALQQWQTKYRAFAAAQYPPTKLTAFISGDIRTPKQIAIFLPRSGQFASVGDAIANGYLQAYYKSLDINEEVEITWFDTETSISADKLYQRAVNAGMDVVIGPFQKPKIAEIARLDSLPIPVLALNKAVESAPQGLYQFPLAPEDEAAQLARQAWQNGHDTAAIIAMNGSWGDRVISAFANEWAALGGRLVSAERFDANSPRLAMPPVQKMLGISISEARQGYLERTIATDVVMEARFRQDLDFIFLAALPEQGRLIRPMFDFLLAGDIPVYSISTIWNEQGNNQDLEGMYVLAPPWDGWANPERMQLKQTMGNLGRENRLYALGLDAFLLQQHIWYLDRLQDHSINGFTGRLSLDTQGVVHRELQWLQVDNGNLFVPQQDAF